MLLNLIAIRVSSHVSNIHMAGKIDDLKSIHPELSDSLDELNRKKIKPKYLDWSVKQLLAGHKIQDIVPTIDYFDKNHSRFVEKDINKYKKLKDLEDEVKLLAQTKSKKQERKETKASGSTKLYEDETYVLIRIEDKKACVEYGKGTEWCVSMEGVAYFEEYSVNDTIFYFWINKKLDQMDPLAKVAVAVVKDGDEVDDDFDIYDAGDNKIDAASVPGLDKVIGTIKSDAKTFDTLVQRFQKNPGKFMKDENDFMRAELSARIKTELLPDMMSDKSETVRANVAERIDDEYLPKMMNDESEEVRAKVADRIGEEYLSEMMNDKSELVQEVIKFRTENN